MSGNLHKHHNIQSKSMLSNINSTQKKPSNQSLVARNNMQIETLASRESNYYEDEMKNNDEFNIL
jgi:hypothetical protein